MNKTPKHPANAASEDDPTLDRYLASLQHFSTGPGFDDRVMAQVTVRRPMPARERPSGVGTLLAGRRGWALAGSMAAGSLASLAVLVSWVTSSMLTPSAVSGWVNAALVVPVWKGLLQGVAAATVWASGGVSAAWAAHGTALLGAVAVVGLLPLVSAWGLVRVLAYDRKKRISAYARY